VFRRGALRFENCFIVGLRPRRYSRRINRAFGAAAMKKAERWFYPGERVQVYYKSKKEWKVATIRSMIRRPKQRSLNPSYYQVTVDGKENPRYYRPRELRPINGAAVLAKPRVRAKRGAVRASFSSR
jgi:hypothetical protein